MSKNLKEKPENTGQKQVKAQRDKKGNNPLTPSGLIEASGLRYSTIKFYSDIGILPFEQKDRRLMRRYNKKEAVKRLNKIKKLKDKRLTIEEIIDYFKDNKNEN